MIWLFILFYFSINIINVNGLEVNIFLTEYASKCNRKDGHVVSDYWSDQEMVSLFQNFSSQKLEHVQVFKFDIDGFLDLTPLKLLTFHRIELYLALEHRNGIYEFFN